MIRILNYLLYFVFGWMLADMVTHSTFPMYVDVPVCIGLGIWVALDFFGKVKSTE